MPGDNRTRIGVLDFDNHGEPPLKWERVIQAVLPVMVHLRLAGHYPLAFRSTGGAGIHVWLVWDEPQPAAAVRLLLSQTLEACGLEAGACGVAEAAAEIFPKQDAVPIDGLGSCIDPPLPGLSKALDPVDVRNRMAAAAEESERKKNLMRERLGKARFRA